MAVNPFAFDLGNCEGLDSLEIAQDHKLSSSAVTRLLQYAQVAQQRPASAHESQRTRILESPAPVMGGRVVFPMYESTSERTNRGRNFSVISVHSVPQIDTEMGSGGKMEQMTEFVLDRNAE